MRRLTSPSELTQFRTSLQQGIDPKKIVVRICMTGCRAYGALEVRDAFIREIGSRGLEDKVEIRETGCHGFCARAPVAAIDPLDIFYQQFSADDVPEIVEETIGKGRVIDRLAYTHPATSEALAHRSDIPFFKGQTQVVLRNCGRIDPRSIEQYIARDGYAALARVLDQKPEDVIEEMKKSGLRGRGGAGFPTGMKWSFLRGAAGEMKYLICNADEGDPGAFMDRAVLEGDPHSVIEGMLVAAFATGARAGYVYVRAEYPIAVEHLKLAVAQATELGLLGKGILGSDLEFTLKIKEGAGAFVCGEETALIASIEGRRGTPRPRPPFPAQAGLWGKPTNINNVETYANVASIILKGAEWYASMGTPSSKGTKIFSLAGRINNTGLVEVPVGLPLHEVIFGIGGGIPRGRRFKAVQMGGPSGGCVPMSYLNLPIDYGSLESVGAIMGSGGMVVMDQNTCMVDVARFFLSFTQIGVLRQMRPLPDRHQTDAGNPHEDYRRRGTGGGHRAAPGDGAVDQGCEPVRSGADIRQPGTVDNPPLQGRVRGAHPEQTLPLGRLRRPRLRPVREYLPCPLRRSRLCIARLEGQVRGGPRPHPADHAACRRLRQGVQPSLRKSL